MKPYVLKPIGKRSSSEGLPESFFSELNDAQREAVVHDDGPILVIAGAGSGKTKTLVYRVARLVSEGIDPAQILLLTFTRKSSREMLNRASVLLDRRCQHVAGGTFHSFANLILREYASVLGYDPQFTILDRSDSEDLIGLIRRHMGYQTLDKRFPKKSTILSVIGKAFNTQKSIRDIIQTESPQFLEFADDFSQISAMYRDEKKRMQVMDYDDLLVNMVALIRQHPTVRDELIHRYRYIMIDEYQDTNHIQAEILQCLAGDRMNVMAVGDDSQSIYSFRGADFKNIMTFPNVFDGAKVITLEENYRSKQPILDLTNAVISQAKYKFSKTLYTQRKGTEKPVFIETASEYDQSRFVTQKMLELREDGVPLNDMAVLVRSGWHSNELEVQLASAGISFSKFGGFKFVETAHVKDVVSVMRLMANPNDVLSWIRVLMLLSGIGAKRAGTLSDELIAHRSDPFKALEKYKKKAFYNDVLSLCHVIFQDVTAKTSLSLLNEVLIFYKPLFREKYDDHHKRESDLESLESIAAKREDLPSFLTDMSLEPPDHSQSHAVPEHSDNERITISTIHSAKGLEWKIVFVLSCVDGYLPSFQSLGDTMQIEEERRLLYVALTRAKDHLFILKPNLDLSSGNYHRFSGVQFSTVSRFLGDSDILANYTDRWSLVEEVSSSIPKKPFRPLYDSTLDDDVEICFNDLPADDSSRRKYSF